MKNSSIALASLFALTACGGGGGSDDSTGTPSAPAPVAESVSGIWTGTVTGQQTGVMNDIACLVTQSEELACLLVDPSSGQLAGGIQGTVSVANTNQISGSGTIHAASGFVLSDGSTFSDFAITSGTVAEASSLDLNGEGAGETYVASFAYDPVYERDATLAAVEGVYTGFTVDGVPTSFSIDGNGVIFAQSQTGCVGNGQIAVKDPQFNEYDVTMTVSNCPGLDGDYAGLAITDDFAATDDELAFAIFSGQRAIFGSVVE